MREKNRNGRAGGLSMHRSMCRIKEIEFRKVFFEFALELLASLINFIILFLDLGR